MGVPAGAGARVAGPGVPPPQDQPARTALAWSRSALGVAAVGALVARYAWVTGGRPELAALPLVAAAAVVVLGARRRRHLRTGVPGALTAHAGAVPAVSALLIAATALAVLLVGVPAPP